MKGKDELRQELILGDKMLSEIFESASKEDFIDLFVESLEAFGGSSDNDTDEGDDEDFYFLPFISDDV